MSPFLLPKPSSSTWTRNAVDGKLRETRTDNNGWASGIAALAGEIEEIRYHYYYDYHHYCNIV